MPKQKFTKTDIIIIVLFFVLYMVSYAWLIEPKKETPKRKENNMMIRQTERQQTENRQLKSLSFDWPDTCGHNEREHDEASYYQDHYDEYQDDPEDELRFPPEIFDANDD